MCFFHLTNDHEGTTCPKNIRHQKLETKRAIAMNIVIEEAPSKGPDDFINYYLEYESNSFSFGRSFMFSTHKRIEDGES